MKKFALVGLSLLIIGVLGTIFNWNQLIGRGKIGLIQHSIEVENDQIKKIDIEGDVAEINFLPTDAETIQLDFSGKSNQTIDELVEVNESEDRLTITINHESRFVNINIFPIWKKKPPVVNVGIPKSFDGSIEALIDVGKIQVDELTINQFVGVVNVGNIKGRNFKLVNGSAEVDVGKIDLSDVSGQWFLETGVGEISLDLSDWEDQVEAHTDIGNIKISVSKKPEFYSLRLETELGKVKGIDEPIVEIRSTKGEVPRLNASTDVGNITFTWGR